MANDTFSLGSGSAALQSLYNHCLLEGVVAGVILSRNFCSQSFCVLPSSQWSRSTFSWTLRPPVGNMPGWRSTRTSLCGAPKVEEPQDRPVPGLVLRVRINPQKVTEHFIKAQEAFRQSQRHLKPWLGADQPCCLMWDGEQGRLTFYHNASFSSWVYKLWGL